jgi:hypothetical protein
LRELEEKYGPLPHTITTLTGGGGEHRLFVHPRGVLISNSASALAPGIDVRTTGGQLVIPPSLHANGRLYAWEVSCHPDDTALAELPARWVQALTTTVHDHAYKEHRRIPEHQRNEILYRRARSLRANGFGPASIEAAIRTAVKTECEGTLDEAEIAKLLKHVQTQADRADFIPPNSSTESTWPNPQPVHTELRPVRPLSLAMVHPVFRGLTETIAVQMQCPYDFPAAGLLVTASTVIGAGCVINPKVHGDWAVSGNVWGGFCSPPGSQKTPIVNASITDVLSCLELDAKQTYDQRKATHEAELIAFKARQDALADEMKKCARGTKVAPSMESLTYDYEHLVSPTAPTWARWRTSDCTIEKMTELLSENPRGMLLLRDELTGLLASWDREDRGADRAFYLESWNGTSSYTVDRIKRGTVHIDNLCISLFGGIQPSKLLSYLYSAVRGASNDGLMQRLQILVYPDPPATWELIDQPTDPRVKALAYRAIQRLAHADFRHFGAQDQDGLRLPFFHFDPAAQELFYAWRTDLQAKLRADEEEPIVIEHLSKYASLMPKLALIFHLLTLASDPHMTPSQVSVEAAERAAAWCTYLESHARRIYGLVTDITRQAAAKLAAKLARKLVPSPFTIRDIQRKDWSLLPDRDAIERACAELVSLGWLREHDCQTPSGQRSEYLINPKILDRSHD